MRGLLLPPEHAVRSEAGEPCTTFRPAERGLAPERQLSFVFRTERTHAAYAFPQPERAASVA